MGFKAPEPPPPLSAPRPTIANTRQQGEEAAKVARLGLAKRITRDSLIIDPAVTTPVTDALNVPKGY